MSSLSDRDNSIINKFFRNLQLDGSINNKSVNDYDDIIFNTKVDLDKLKKKLCLLLKKNPETFYWEAIDNLYCQFVFFIREITSLYHNNLSQPVSHTFLKTKLLFLDKLSKDFYIYANENNQLLNCKHVILDGLSNNPSKKDILYKQFLDTFITKLFSKFHEVRDY